ncbi:large ribosomal subunit protein mL62 [Tribolium castaneum]|uniref:Large ribosomal subunit protein mL62 n=1 Tax=Tribolium castaneum TaxID=7070 RepID=D6WUY9_TRICA|nr:PREDICTED: peptidyl-tRNA hydrolase ICT1, mitochondrial [Tribolium castaneum]EFA08510.1 Peptidyl-tRNA hydrolase ICT1, mitochondrial-like Protein [Tribolium castaneum]|eukprot:XP_973768.1 PREDICTED: peptidyl-tRNA hydrolase ICT1, mitochondrial [Tribolium castaneum]
MSQFCQKLAKFVVQGPRLYATSAYKSSISLQNLYPNSSLKLTTPSKPPNEGDKFTGYVPIDQLDITYSRSTGPGGQNVNKVNTKVEIRFHVNSATWINDQIKAKMLEKFKNKVTKEGFVVFRSDLTRSQQLNLADCLEKIRASVRSCIVEDYKPSEETAEKIRRRLEKATRERLSIKRMRSQTKSDRRAPEII